MITLTLPDGSKREFENGTTGLQVAESISSGLARNALSITWNKQIFDLNRVIPADGNITINTWDSEDGKYTFWHSSAHILAEAVQSFFPDAKFAIGPPIENGFYYDIDFGDHKVSAEDLEKIENKMMDLVKQKLTFTRKEVSKADALSYFTEKGDPYKLELIDGLEDGQITFYTQGDFTDLCRGPHLPDTSQIKAVKLMSLAGAYWRGDENNKQLTRIYGITFPKKSLLDEYLVRLEEAKKRDHKKLGKQLQLFMFNPMVGRGLPVWLPKGTTIRRILEAFLRDELLKRGYQEVITPHIGNLELYKTSGHYPYYSDSQFAPITVEDEQYMLKPMNCPHHHQVYSSEPRSYRDLPIRLAEFGSVYRYEQSGELNGLSRVRGFTQDDAHIYCTEDQLAQELDNAIDLTQLVFKTFDMPVKTRLSFRDPENTAKYAGTDEMWNHAESVIHKVADDMGLDYFIGIGEAAFYGPKFDFIVQDAIGRKWQLGTVQVDYVMPERFGLQYVGSDNSKHRPVIIHRAPFGSMERFLSILIEHFAGDFPLWLSPVQVRLLSISETYNAFTDEVAKKLRAKGLRVETDTRNEQIGGKIREAETEKIPYMAIIGEKEAESNSLAIRRHKMGNQGSIEVDAFIAKLVEEVETKAMPPSFQKNA
ncbi:threonine--tRNA ligase [bacterium]|nr:MAG: threonine--tRNA ligase [bacterium]